MIQKGNKLKLRIYFALVFLTSCNIGQENTKETSVPCQMDIALSSLAMPILVENDTTVIDSNFKRSWQKLTEYDFHLINYLLTFRGSKKYGYYCDKKKYHIGYNDPRTNLKSLNGYRVTTEVEALHLICALYYDDYYFSATRELYSLHDSMAFIRSDILPSWVTTVNNDTIIEKAWSFCESWVKRNEGKSLEEARHNGEWPLEGSGLYWIGQSGGPLTFGYPQKLNERLQFRKTYNDSIVKLPFK